MSPAGQGREEGLAARVAAVDVSQALLKSVADELRALGAEVLILDGDMGDPDAPTRVVEEVVERFGGLDGLVSNAGINRPGRLAEYAVTDCATT